MGSFFNGGSRAKPRYERLPLDTFYPMDSISIHQRDVDEDNTLFELGDLGQKGPLLSTKNGYDSEEEIEFYKDTRAVRSQRKHRNCSPRCRLLSLLIIVIFVLLLCGFYLVGPSVSYFHVTNKKNGNWNSAHYRYATETAIRLYDVNLDGIQDVILGAAATSSLNDIAKGPAYCQSIKMDYPCAGRLLALDGRNGAKIWDIGLEEEVFAIQCGKLDINGDGHKDCIVAGRMSALFSIDLIKGEILWSADRDVTVPHFNFYQGQVVPDLDSDGVPDYVITHGGDTRFSDTELDRPAGRLLLLSGKTGKTLGRYITMPDAHESYSSITLYKRSSGAVYLLFGSGGETIAGSLWTISLRDLYCYVTSIESCDADSLTGLPFLQSSGYDDPWGSPLRTLPSGIREIIRSGSGKGVTVPTELVDMNNDGVDDLVVFMYNCTIVVLDGVDLNILWSTGRRFANYETYSNPAPGYFNDDDTLDLMVTLNKGTWPDFTESYVYILDGKNGELLWSLKMAPNRPVMSSPITIQSREHKDAFLFWVQGLHSNSVTEETAGTNNGHMMRVPSSHQRLRRHGSDHHREKPCQMNLDMYRSELLLMDRDLALSPLRLATIYPSLYNYTLTDEDRKSHQHSEPVSMGPVMPEPTHSALSTTEGETVTQEDIARHDQSHKPTVVASTVPEEKETTAATEIVTSPLQRKSTVSYTTDFVSGTNNIVKTSTAHSNESLSSAYSKTTPMSNVDMTQEANVTTAQETISETPTAALTTQETTTEITTTQETSTEVATSIATMSETTTEVMTSTATPSEMTTDVTTSTATPSEMTTDVTTSTATPSEMTTEGTTSILDTTQELKITANHTTGSVLQETTTERFESTESFETTTNQTSEIITTGNEITVSPDGTTQVATTWTDESNKSTTTLQPETSASSSESAKLESTMKPETTTPSTMHDSSTSINHTEKISPGQSRQRREIPGGNLCTVYVPVLFGTGIIGDLDGDGNLDYIYAETYMAEVLDEGSSFISSKISLTVHRLVINSAIRRPDWVGLGKSDDAVFLSDSVTPTVDRENIDQHFRFLPAEKQSWTSYMGKDVDGKFTKDNS